MIGEDLEGRGPARPLADGANTVSRLRRSVALQGIGRQWQPAAATMIGEDLEGCGPSQPLADGSQHRFTATTERSPPADIFRRVLICLL